MEKTFGYKYKDTPMGDKYTKEWITKHLEAVVRQGNKLEDYEIFEVTRVSLGTPKLVTTIEF